GHLVDRRYLGAERPQLPQHLLRRLVGQVADVDVHPAIVGHDVDHVAAADAADVDGWVLVQLRAAGRERQLQDPAVELERLQYRVIAQPRGRAVRGPALHVDAHDQDALGLHTD